jgi:hypothetical protein
VRWQRTEEGPTAELKGEEGYLASDGKNLDLSRREVGARRKTMYKMRAIGKVLALSTNSPSLPTFSSRLAANAERNAN